MSINQGQIHFDRDLIKGEITHLRTLITPQGSFEGEWSLVLREVKTIDLAGISFLALLLRAIHADGGKPRFFGATAGVQEILKISGLHRLAPFLV